MMTWIEQLWGVAPDGGSGTLEVVLVLLALLAVGYGVRARRVYGCR